MPTAVTKYTNQDSTSYSKLTSRGVQTNDVREHEQHTESCGDDRPSEGSLENVHYLVAGGEHDQGDEGEWQLN